MSEVDVLESPSDYNEMAQLALEAGSPGEAQKVLEKGFAANVFQRAAPRIAIRACSRPSEDGGQRPGGAA
jgi:hypothetical protein